MYSIGEEFTYDIKKEEIRFYIIGDFFINKKEYLITEDEDKNRYLFIYNDEELEHIQDSRKSKDLIRKWEDEYYGTVKEVDLWDENYTDEEIEINKENENYTEEENNYEEVEDLNSYIDNLVSENN